MKFVPGRALNRILQLISRFGLGANRLRLSNRRLGSVKLGRNPWTFEDEFLENHHCDRIEIGDETQLTIQAITLTHFRGPVRVITGPYFFGCVLDQLLQRHTRKPRKCERMR